MENLALFQTAIEEFPWESEEQKEGYLAFVQYQRQFGIMAILPIRTEIAFFIQKDIDSNSYWRDMVGNQVTDLQNQIQALQEKVAESSRLNDSMMTTLKSLQAATEARHRQR